MPILYRAPLPADGERAIGIFEKIMENAGDGSHRIVLTVNGIGGDITVTLRFLQHGDAIVVNPERAIDLVEMLAVAVSGAHTGGAVLRTQTAPDRSHVCAWKIVDGDPMPLNRAEVFNVYCTDAETGEIIPPEHGVEYKDAPVVHL